MAIGWAEAIGAASLAAAVMAVLTVVLPARRLAPGILLWLGAPAIGYVGMIGWEMATRTPQANALGTAFYGFALLGPIFLPPWLLVCGVGLLPGLLLRRRLRPARDGLAARCEGGPHGAKLAAPPETTALIGRSVWQVALPKDSSPSSPAR